MKKRKLALDEHVALAERLQAIRSELMAVQGRIGEAYGYSSRPYYSHVGKAVGWLDQLRSELDGLLAREFPREFAPSIYYGASKNR